MTIQTLPNFFFFPNSISFPTNKDRQVEDSQEWKQLPFALVPQHQGMFRFHGSMLSTWSNPSDVVQLEELSAADWLALIPFGWGGVTSTCIVPGN